MWTRRRADIAPAVHPVMRRIGASLTLNAGTRRLPGMRKAECRLANALRRLEGQSRAVGPARAKPCAVVQAVHHVVPAYRPMGFLPAL